mgnify:CR=1 FL=1
MMQRMIDHRCRIVRRNTRIERNPESARSACLDSLRTPRKHATNIAANLVAHSLNLKFAVLIVGQIAFGLDRLVNAARVAVIG